MSRENNFKNQDVEVKSKNGCWSEHCIGLWHRHLTSLTNNEIPPIPQSEEQAHENHETERPTCYGISSLRMRNVEFAEVEPSLSRLYGVRNIWAHSDIKNGKQYQVGAGINNTHAIIAIDIITKDDDDPLVNHYGEDQNSLMTDFSNKLSELKALTSEDVLNSVRSGASQFREGGIELGKMVKQDLNEVKRWLKSFWK